MRLLLLYTFCTLSLFSFSQKKIKYETVFFEDKTFESPTIKINVTGALSEFDVIKSKLKVNNYSDKTIVIKPEECYFTTHQGNIFSRDKWIVIAPRDNESKVIDIKADNIKTDSTTLHLNGMYICKTQDTFSAPSMPMPPQKEISIGNFRLELDGFDRDGKEIMVRYKVRYAGDKIGMCIPSKVTLKSAEGGEYKNQKEKTPESSKKLLKNRHVIENVFAKLKRFGRICMRKDKLVSTFKGFLFLATILTFKK